MKKRRNAISPAKAASASDGLDAAKARLAELETKADEGKEVFFSSNDHGLNIPERII